MSKGICKICGSERYRKYLDFKNKKRQIVICKNCGTWQTIPYFVMDYTDRELYCEHYIKNEQLFRGFARSLLEIIKRYKNTGMLLDIGCSVGFLLEEASKIGFQTRGIELNKKAISIAASKGLSVKECDIDEACYDEDFFDVVISNHTLEHIIEPHRFLQSIRRILKKDAILTIGVPNHDSLVAHIYRTRWYGWGLPDHIWHFDKKSLTYLLCKNGFKIIEMVQNSQYYLFSKSLRKNTMASIAYIGDRLGWGDQLVAVAGKV